jgi:hypothetical protein
MRKIKRVDLLYFYEFEHYIKDKCPIVKDVYSSSMYFDKTNACCHLSWGPWCDGKLMTTEMQDMVLRGINAICGTEFVFED